MNNQITELASRLERTARDNAKARVAAAVAPLMEPLTQDLRRALHHVVGGEADVVVVELVNDLRTTLIQRASKIAEQQAIKDIVQRMTAEVSA